MKDNSYPGFVYFIQDSHTKRIKIGFAVNPAARLKELQTGSSTKLTLLSAWPSPMVGEYRLHQYFAEYRVNGEWFEMPYPDEALIHAVITTPHKRVKPSDVKTVNRIIRPPFKAHRDETAIWIEDSQGATICHLAHPIASDPNAFDLAEFLAAGANLLHERQEHARKIGHLGGRPLSANPSAAALAKRKSRSTLR